MKVTTTDGKRYLEEWVLALHELLGWDRQRAMTWATHYEGALNDDESQLWREYSVFYISFLLIPDSVKGTLKGMDGMNVARRLEAAILGLPECKGPLEMYDWNAAIARVDAVLAKYGASLATVRQQYE